MEIVALLLPGLREEAAMLGSHRADHFELAKGASFLYDQAVDCR